MFWLMHFMAAFSNEINFTCLKSSKEYDGKITLTRSGHEAEAPTQCNYKQARNVYPYCSKVIQALNESTTNKVALWHAGGNWGDLYSSKWKVVVAKSDSPAALSSSVTSNFVVLQMFKAHALLHLRTYSSMATR